MNYLEELQKINEDYQKAKLVVESCLYAEQLNSAIAYSTNFVRYHCGRLGISNKYDHRLKWFFCERNKHQKNKIIEYIDLCVADLQDLVELKKLEVLEGGDITQIGYGDRNMMSMLRIQSEVKKWEDKKNKEGKNVYRTTKREKLQVD